MARRPNAEPIYQAADLFRRRCLTTGHSLLWPDHEAWTGETLAQLWEAIVGRPDEGKRRFEDKLRDQLASLRDDAHRVTADTIGFYSLFSTMVTPEKKEKNLEEIVSWRFKENPPNLDVLRQAFKARGIGSAGLHYNISIPWQFAYILKFAEFALLERADLAESVACKVLADRALKAVPQAVEARHIVLHLLFPDEFERIASERHKQRIVRVFARFASGAQDVDVALSNIRRALVAQYGRPDIDFYERDIESQWQEPSDEVEKEEVTSRESLRDGLESFLSGYVAARTNEAYRGQSPIVQVLRRLQTQFERSDPVRRRPSLRVAASAGAGNWAGVPWIAFLDNDETTSIQKGVYCVYLFREDMSGVYLTLNQGVSEPTEQQGWRSAEKQLLETVARLRQQFPQLVRRGFALTDDIDLRAHGDLGQMYEVATIAHRLYETGAIPGDDVLLEDLDSVLSAYGEYVEGKTTGPKAWIFQANPELFNVGGALRQLKEMTWVTRQHGDAIRAGDTVFVWQSGREAGIVATASVLSDPQPMKQLDEEKRFSLSDDKFAGLQPRVRIRIERVLPARIERTSLLEDPVLGSLTVLTAPQGTNFAVTKEQAEALNGLIADGSRRAVRPPRLDLRAVVDEFGAALRASHVSFGSRHDEVVRSFVASLATKRFVILTGLSGSGKTQLGLQFGDWLGRSTVVAVRPDWTGAEALFGYEDALREAAGGRRAWQVPGPLRFILQAARDPARPYLLLLDEMNLAHVERYFADVLSGMESDKACVPNLETEGDGLWRVPVGAEATIPVPKNLLVVGTVNVDETTYMFSPKVLDRANTFEFRVRTNDLELGHEKPVAIDQGDPELVAGFLAIASDDRWHIDHPAPSQEVFAQHFRTAHALLSKDGFEFGHRVFYEAVRFAAMLVAAGDDDPFSALDLQVMQKVLPRLHGSRRRLEPTLCALGRFCHDLSFDAQVGLRDAASRFDETRQAGLAARLPISFDKVSRMVSTLRANQFVSFTE